MNTELETKNSGVSATIQEKVLLEGDLSKLTPAERINYSRALCDSLGLNMLSKPFQYIQLGGRLVLYATKDATEQLRKNHNISIEIKSREVVEGVYVVTARATNPDGRSDESIGAVPIDKLMGEARSNAMMKAETKAKRRVTLSICGLGMLDESEVDPIPGAVVEKEISGVEVKEPESKSPKLSGKAGLEQFLSMGPSLPALVKAREKWLDHPEELVLIDAAITARTES